VRTYLGIDGGGSKTAFLLIDDSGRALASHAEGPAYYLETGWDAMRAMLARQKPQQTSWMSASAAGLRPFGSFYAPAW
jgi:N-acetylglucosamine kinase-like BadF-type ATPase